MAKGVQGADTQGLLGGYLHDLGKILYFRDDPILSAMVILKPNWVTKAISQVLEDRATCDNAGILAHADLPRIWASDEQHEHYDPALYPIFLHLMERFELCYQIHPLGQWEDVTHSLIPQLLPYEPPASLPTWTAADEKEGKLHVQMTYRLDFVPAGIMGWFIYRAGKTRRVPPRGTHPTGPTASDNPHPLEGGVHGCEPCRGVHGHKPCRTG